MRFNILIFIWFNIQKLFNSLVIPFGEKFLDSLTFEALLSAYFFSKYFLDLIILSFRIFHQIAIQSSAHKTLY